MDGEAILLGRTVIGCKVILGRSRLRQRGGDANSCAALQAVGKVACQATLPSRPANGEEPAHKVQWVRRNGKGSPAQLNG